MRALYIFKCRGDNDKYIRYSWRRWCYATYVLGFEEQLQYLKTSIYKVKVCYFFLLILHSCHFYYSFICSEGTEIKHVMLRRLQVCIGKVSYCAVGDVKHTYRKYTLFSIKFNWTRHILDFSSFFVSFN